MYLVKWISIEAPSRKTSMKIVGAVGRKQKGRNCACLGEMKITKQINKMLMYQETES